MANNHSISDFIGGFNGGFRPNRFKVQGAFGSAGEKETTFHIRTASMPASSLTTISLPYRGRNFKMPGNRTYAPWAITVLDDNNLEGGTSLWEHFNSWSNRINNHIENTSNSTSRLDFTNEMADWNVFQLDINGVTRKKITLKNCWPAEVGPISLNMDDNEGLSIFTATLEYSWYELGTNVTNNRINRNNASNARTS